MALDGKLGCPSFPMPREHSYCMRTLLNTASDSSLGGDWPSAFTQAASPYRCCQPTDRTPTNQVNASPDSKSDSLPTCVEWCLLLRPCFPNGKPLCSLSIQENTKAPDMF